MLTKIQQKAIKHPCPHCEDGQLHEVQGLETNEGIKENYLWCNSCLLSMDSSGGYTT